MLGLGLHYKIFYKGILDWSKLGYVTIGLYYKTFYYGIIV
jgi:hypothetical protein